MVKVTSLQRGKNSPKSVGHKKTQKSHTMFAAC